LIKKIAHLRGENSEPSPGPKNDRVVIGQFRYCRNRRFLIMLKPGLFATSSGNNSGTRLMAPSAPASLTPSATA
jgi:hypothetical protein